MTVPIELGVQHEGDLPLSHEQLTFWLTQQSAAPDGSYVVRVANRVRGLLDVSALEAAINDVVRRHEVLRTSYVLHEGRLIAEVAATLTLSIDVIAVSVPDEAAWQPAMDAEGQAMASAPIDLARGPVVRVRLLRASERDHVLIVGIHHIASDHRSCNLFIREMLSFYVSRTQGAPLELAPLTSQYGDYALSQRRRLTPARLARHRAYWRKQLEGAPFETPLPFDRSSDGRHSQAGAHLTSVLPEGLWEAVLALAARADASPFAILLTALKLSLRAWTETNDLVIGTVTSNRGRREDMPLIGCFLSFLAIRTELPLSLSWGQCIDHVKDAVLDAFRHRECPYVEVVNAVAPKRGRSGSALYNVALLLNDEQGAPVTVPGLTVDSVAVARSSAELDLRVVVSQARGQWRLTCEYVTALFDAETIEALSGCFIETLTTMTSSPQTALAAPRLPSFLREQARRSARLRAAATSTLAVAATFTAEPLAESVAYWLEQLGHRSQISFAPFGQVFQELLGTTGSLGANRMGVNVVLIRFEDLLGEGGTTRPVGATLRRTLEGTIAELLDALAASAKRTGVAHLVCVCPATPAARADADTARMFSELEAKMSADVELMDGVSLVTSAAVEAQYPVERYHDAAGLALGHVPYTPAAYAALGTMIARRVSNLATPPVKVIVLDCDNTLWDGVCGELGPRAVGVAADRRALQAALIAQQEAGVLLCLCSKNVEADVRAVFEQHDAMLLRQDHLVASRINWAPKSENLRALSAELGIGLDAFVFIDDNPVECAEVRAACPEVVTLQLPPAGADFAAWFRRVWAFDRRRVTVEDRARTQLYAQQAQRTALRAQSTSFSDFLAGLGLEVDIAPLAPAHVARVAQLTQRTNQLNTTTLRKTEPEIARLAEAAAPCLVASVRDRFGDYGLVGVGLCSDAGSALVVDSFMLSCRALGRGVEHRLLAALGQLALDRGRDSVEVRFVASAKNRPCALFLESLGIERREDGGPGSATYLIAAEQCRALRYAPVEGPPELPPAAVPTAGPSLTDSRPRSRVYELAAGELSDPLRLCALLDGRRAGSARTRIAGERRRPSNETEAWLCELYARLLGLGEIGVDEGFFDLSGNSLLALQVVARVHTEFGVQLAFQAMLDGPTVAQLAAQIDALRATSAGGGSSPVQDAVVSLLTDRSELPLTENQHKLVQAIERRAAMAFVRCAMSAGPSLDRGALTRALEALALRHESLGSRYVRRGDERFAVAGDAKVRLVERDVAHLDKAAQTEALADLYGALTPDVWEGPLLRAAAIRVAADDWRIEVLVPHAEFDQQSVAILQRDLHALYVAARDGTPAALPPLPFQVADFAGWQRALLTTEPGRAQLDYWRRKLDGRSPAKLPSDVGGASSPRGGAKLARRIDLGPVWTSIRTLRTTPFMAALASVLVVIARTRGKDDFALHSSAAGRDVVGSEHLIGCFTIERFWTLPDEPRRSFRWLLAQLSEQATANHRNGVVPFSRELGLPAELVTAFNFAYTIKAPSPKAGAGFALAPPVVPSPEVATADFDFGIWTIETPDELVYQAGYRTDLYSRSTIERFLDRYGRCFRLGLSDADLELGEIVAQVWAAE